MEEQTESKDFKPTCLSRQQVVDLLNDGKAKATEVNITYVRTKLDVILNRLEPCLRNNLCNEEITLIAKETSKMYQAYQNRWRSVKYVKHLFEKKHGVWSNQAFKLPASVIASPELSEPEEPRERQQEEDDEPQVDDQQPGTSFQSLAPRSQRRRMLAIKRQANEVPVKKLLKVVGDVAQQQKRTSEDSEEKKYLESISEICKTATISPGRPEKIVQSMKLIGKVRNYTPEEALALFIDLNLTVEKYKAFREGNKNLPPYHLVEKQKKACYPEEELNVTQRLASVSLASLLKHTTSRIIKLQEEPDNLLSTYAQTKNLASLDLNFYYSWGFDGSSGHSAYKQGWDDDEVASDQSLFATTIIPLRLVDPTNPNRPLWQNPTPQSVRYCRPLRLQFIKETIQTILDERKWVQDQINSLEVETFKVECPDGDIDIKVTFILNLTLIDGKVLGAITNTRSLMNCCLCQAKEKDFHDLSRVWKANTDALEHGLSPLHAWIRTLEFLLHLGYKNVDGVRRKVVRKKSPAGEKVKQRTEWIKQRIKDELKVTVDAPKPGGAGSTNDGNTARMLLSDKNRKKFADILGLKEWLLDDLHVLLSVLSCGLEIDSEKFGDFCNILRVKYITEYDWYHMPSTIHKILAHGKQVVEAMALPIGMFSEQASESCNKLYKQNRRSSTTKVSRRDTMLGLIRRSLESSDPIISNFRLERRQRKLNKIPLPSKALDLLKPVSFEENEDADYDNELMDESLEEHHSPSDAELDDSPDEDSRNLTLERSVLQFEVDVCRAPLSDEDFSEDQEEFVN